MALTLAPPDLLTRLGRKTDTPELDGLLVQAALHLDGWRTPEDLAVALLDPATASTFLGPPQTFTCLYAVAANGALDTLAQHLHDLVEAVGDAAEDNRQPHEDVPLCLDEGAGCATCNGILRDRIDEQLAFLKCLLYGRALWDLKIAAAA